VDQTCKIKGSLSRFVKRQSGDKLIKAGFQKADFASPTGKSPWNDDVYSNPATYFHYDGWNLLQEGNNSWGPARVYVHGNRVDEIVWSSNTFMGHEAFHQYDARGHCTHLTDRSGNLIEQYEYDAFGQPYFYDESGNSVGAYDAQGLWAGYSLFGNRFLFTGREWLSDVKVYDFRNRMYQPELGRFMQPDPKHFEASDYILPLLFQANPFAFCEFIVSCTTLSAG
jgi:RHS repeat-associated protein